MFDRAVSFTEVFLFVWRYWRQQPAKFALIVAGVVLSILLEVQIPDRSAELVTAVLRIGEGPSALSQAWTAAFWLLGVLALVCLVQQGYFRIWMSLSWVAPANRLSNDADTKMGGVLADSITCNSVVKSFGA